MALETLSGFTAIAYNDNNVETMLSLTPVSFNDITGENIMSFSPVTGTNDIIYTSNDKRIITAGNKTILGKIIKRR